MLELDRVVKHYRSAGEDVAAIDGVSLRVGAGELVAVQGPSGSGKTTLLLLIARLLSPDGGSIRFRGTDLAGLSDDDASEYLMREVGFIYQTFHLMPRVSVLENASLKLVLAGVGVRSAQARAIAWLERVGLGERLEHTTEQLSGGERQRVAIARALTGDPALILADEPTGNLDSARSAEIVELLRAVAHEQGSSVVLVTHDADAAAASDRRLALRDGRLLERDAGGAGSAAATDGGAVDQGAPLTDEAPPGIRASRRAR
jgi:putative ABC transport system ATP-binding protein